MPKLELSSTSIFPASSSFVKLFHELLEETSSMDAAAEALTFVLEDNTGALPYNISIKLVHRARIRTHPQVEMFSSVLKLAISKPSQPNQKTRCN